MSYRTLSLALGAILLENFCFGEIPRLLPLPGRGSKKTETALGMAWPLSAS